jgi:putative oxidoreductase
MQAIAAVLYDLPIALTRPLAWAGPLVARITVGWVFVTTGWGKLHNLDRIVDYFRELGIPHAELQAPFASANELVCGLLILVGLGTRYACVPLIVVMCVAIGTAQWENVDSAAAFLGLTEAAYIAFFVWLGVAGPGPVSLDHLIARAAGRSASSPQNRPRPGVLLSAEGVRYMPGGKARGRSAARTSGKTQRG